MLRIQLAILALALLLALVLPSCIATSGDLRELQHELEQRGDSRAAELVADKAREIEMRAEHAAEVVVDAARDPMGTLAEISAAALAAFFGTNWYRNRRAAASTAAPVGGA